MRIPRLVASLWGGSNENRGAPGLPGNRTQAQGMYPVYECMRERRPEDWIGNYLR